ncbi:14142_t:CDS:2, partial [Funneliformis mosseae]
MAKLQNAAEITSEIFQELVKDSAFLNSEDIIELYEALQTGINQALNGFLKWMLTMDSFTFKYLSIRRQLWSRICSYLLSLQEPNFLQEFEEFSNSDSNEYWKFPI